MSTLAERLAAIEARIDAACARCGRARDEVRLVAVSKGQPAEAIAAARAAGQRLFGESYVQELGDKAAAFLVAPSPDAVAGPSALSDAEVHFIGGLQTNKVKALMRVAPLTVVESVGSERLARALAKEAAAQAKTLPIFLQVNIGREPQKGGVLPEALPALVSLARAEPSLVLRGLMTIPPADEDPRPRFRALRALARAHDLPECSMGMSDDFEVAIEEGATLVRVGTAIFGPRA